MHNSKISAFLSFLKIDSKKETKHVIQFTLEETQCKSGKIVFLELGICKSYKKLEE